MLYKQWEYLKIHYIYIDRDRTNHKSAFLHVKSAKRNVENLSYNKYPQNQREKERALNILWFVKIRSSEDRALLFPSSGNDLKQITPQICPILPTQTSIWKDYSQWLIVVAVSDPELRQT